MKAGMGVQGDPGRRGELERVGQLEARASKGYGGVEI